jgi:hypothetical protein
VQIRIVQDTAARFLRDNATTVLTAGGVVGTVATGVLSVRAGMKYSEIIRQEEIRRTAEATADHSPGPVTITDKAKLVGVHFIPPVVVGGLTITSVVMAHRMSAAKAAALAARSTRPRSPRS